MLFKKLFIVLVTLYVTVDAYCGVNDWITYSKSMSRESIAVDGPNTINDNILEWVADTDPQDSNYIVSFEGTTQPIVYNGRVYAYAKYFEWINGYREQTHSQIIAYNANTGNMLWSTVIDAAAYSSWSTPCIDAKHNTLLIGSGYSYWDGTTRPGKVYAINALTGAIVWTTQLYGLLVNASICTAIDIPNARAFITDYDPVMGTGRLYCINLDANGQIIWSQVIGNTCGNTPAYRNGVLYVTTLGDGTWNNSYGTIRAYDATANSAVELWRVTNPDNEGFWGGVVITKEGFLYTASFDFNYEGGDDNSSLFKIDCNNGNIVWVTQIVSTDVVPIVVGNAIYIDGTSYWGGGDKVEAFYDMGSSVVKLWETSAGMVIGSWSNQMVYANGKLYVGASSPHASTGEYDELYILNTTVMPNNPNFIMAHYTNNACGNSRAVTYDSIYAIGPDGLFKFHQPALLADINKDNKVDFYDLAELTEIWLYDGAIGTTRADLDLDGKINFIDFSLLADSWNGKLN